MNSVLKICNFQDIPLYFANPYPLCFSAFNRIIELFCIQDELHRALGDDQFVHGPIPLPSRADFIG